MCTYLQKIILNIYGHLYPCWIYPVFLGVIPFLLIQPCFLLRLPPSAMLSQIQEDTCSLDSLICSFMLLDYCCRCCGFTLIKRHGPISLKTTPSDTWVSTDSLADGFYGSMTKRICHQSGLHIRLVVGIIALLSFVQRHN